MSVLGLESHRPRVWRLSCSHHLLPRILFGEKYLSVQVAIMCTLLPVSSLADSLWLGAGDGALIRKIYAMVVFHMEGMDILCGLQKSSISNSNLSFQTWKGQELLWVKDPDFSFSAVTPISPTHPSPCLSCSQRTNSSPLLPRSAFPDSTYFLPPWV